MKIKVNPLFLKGFIGAVLFLVIWFTVFSFLVKPRRSQDLDGLDSIYHEQYEFSVEYPLRWIARTYGDSGYKGGHDIKMIISNGSIISDFNIKILVRESTEPTLEDVIDWSNDRISINQQTAIDRGNEYLEIYFKNDLLNNEEIARRKYLIGTTLQEEFYIARSGDMIIIALQSDESTFDNHIDDFEGIVQSFAPIE